MKPLGSVSVTVTLVAVSVEVAALLTVSRKVARLPAVGLLVSHAFASERSAPLASKARPDSAMDCGLGLAVPDTVALL